MAMNTAENQVISEIGAVWMDEPGFALGEPVEFVPDVEVLVPEGEALCNKTGKCIWRFQSKNHGFTYPEPDAAAAPPKSEVSAL